MRQQQVGNLKHLWMPTTLTASIANDDTIAASPLAVAVCSFLHAERLEWTGIASQLQQELCGCVENHQILSDKKQWQQTAKVLSERLNRIAPALRKAGVEIVRESGKNHQRLINPRRA